MPKCQGRLENGGGPPAEPGARRLPSSVATQKGESDLFGPLSYASPPEPPDEMLLLRSID